LRLNTSEKDIEDEEMKETRSVTSTEAWHHASGLLAIRGDAPSNCTLAKYSPRLTSAYPKRRRRSPKNFRGEHL